MIVALAWRNLWRHKRRTFLSATAIAAICALTIFLPSLQLGSYQAMVRAAQGVLEGYLQIQHPEYLDKPATRNSFKPDPELKRELAEQGVTLVERAVGFALLSSDSRSIGVQVLGVEPERESRVSTLPANVIEGRYLNAGDEVVLGVTLARNLRLSVGDRVTLLGTGRDGSLAVDSLTVVGLFSSGFAALDRQLAQIELNRFDSTFSMLGHRHALILETKRTPDEEALRAVAVDYGLMLRNWQALNPGLLHAIQLDISSAVLMYLILILVVSFSMVNAMLMSVLERSREFGMVMALGVRPLQLGRILWLENLMVTLLGLLVGALIGVAATLWYEHQGIHFTDAEEVFAQYGLSSVIYPALSPLTLLAGPMVIVMVLMLAGLYPVWRIHRMNLLDAMRAT